MADLTRRNVLTAGAIGVAGAALVGCSSGDDATPAATEPASAAPRDVAGSDRRRGHSGERRAA